MTEAMRPAVRAAAVTLLILVTGCSHLPTIRWPWRHRPTAPPQEVHELLITGADGTKAGFPQYWRRNTLVVDLRGAGGSGTLLLKPAEGTSWPVRLALRVTPGAIGMLELRGDQRLVLRIAPQGTNPLDLDLAPGIYTPRTAQISVSWGPDATAVP